MIRLILSVADKMNANFRVLLAMCRYRFSMPDSTTRRGVVISFFVNLDGGVQVGEIILHNQIEHAVDSAAGKMG